MKYMIMTFGSAEAGLAAMGREWMLEMIQFMKTLDDDLRKSGELVSEEGLADGSTAKTGARPPACSRSCCSPTPGAPPAPPMMGR